MQEVFFAGPPVGAGGGRRCPARLVVGVLNLDFSMGDAGGPHTVRFGGDESRAVIRVLAHSGLAREVAATVYGAQVALAAHGASANLIDVVVAPGRNMDDRPTDETEVRELVIHVTGGTTAARPATSRACSRASRGRPGRRAGARC